MVGVSSAFLAGSRWGGSQGGVLAYSFVCVRICKFYKNGKKNAASGSKAVPTRTYADLAWLLCRAPGGTIKGNGGHFSNLRVLVGSAEHVTSLSTHWWTFSPHGLLI